MKKIIRFTDEYKVKEKIILRDHLALQRTKLANERTLLMFVKSSIYLIIAGVAFINMKDFDNMPYLGIACLSTSGIILIIGIIRYYQLRKYLDRIYKSPELFDTESD